MTKNLLTRPILLTLLLGMSSFSSWAASFAPQEFPETVESTPVIIRGKIGMSYSDWGHDADGTRRLYTFYEVQAPEALKSEVAAPSIIIRELGGVKDGIGLSVSGTATFERGEDVVVFLQNRNSEGNYDLQGMMMGKYNVATNSEGIEMIVGAGLLGQSNPSRKMWSLDDLRSLIHSQEKGSNTRTTSSTALPKPSSPATPQAPSQTPSPALPQPIATEATQSPFLIWLAGLITLGGVGLLGFFLSRRKK